MATQAEIVGAFQLYNKECRDSYVSGDHVSAENLYPTVINLYNQIDGNSAYTDDLSYTQEIIGKGSDSMETAKAQADYAAGKTLLAEGEANQPTLQDRITGSLGFDPNAAAIVKDVKDTATTIVGMGGIFTGILGKVALVAGIVIVAFLIVRR